MTRLATLMTVALLLSCSSNGATPLDGGRDGGLDLPLRDAPPGDAARDGARGDAAREAARGDAPRDHAAADAAPVGLPFAYTRPPVGAPITAAELTAITDKYLDLLKKTSYFDFLDERVHGWPQSDPKKRYWYGTWWSGVGLNKSGGKVTFVHVNVGADNNGIGTSPVLEGVCFAHKQWPSAKRELLVRRLVRGLNSWILAMERQPNDPAGTLLARVAYPEPITSTDGGRTVYIDYSADRPGLDSFLDYVHIPANPYWGDIWIKNKRSKDDIGHMLRALATLDDCATGFSADTLADIAATLASYTKWAKKVEADSWIIATYDKNAQPYLPPLSSTMSNFYLIGNAECDAALALRLAGQGNPGTFSCGDGIHPLELLAMTNDHNGEIVRTFHEAAVRWSLKTGQIAAAKTMLTGLAKRVEEGVTAAEANKLPVWLSPESLADLLVHSANTGVPLTAREVRWLHQRIAEAYTSYVTQTPPQVYRVFDPTTPDGDYEYAPGGKGMELRSLALLIGTCTAKYSNPASVPVLDCARLKSWTP